ncbi:hypothetical protein [Planomonospora sp. ID82291]|uniref:hypothetical protein n=1 Tax=Planomonospora sp. ID82291 TaxID=2738136 RepID=UPI0018C3C458|nr:hypothetical protein [Planomonospora sp. ID82291]MBG0818938.1 hypothetical protein [Planomonospora sp. ID82291]
MTATAVRLVPFNATLPALIQFLDASPVWERATRRSGFLTWDLSPDVSDAVYGGRHHSVSLLPVDVAKHVDTESWCADAVNTINAVALGLDPSTRPDAVERLAAIYRLAEPGSTIALIASGQVEAVEPA